MFIRRSTPTDMPQILRIYEEARNFMRQNGNPSQWKDWHPSIDMIERDTSLSGKGYVCEDNSEITAVFYYNVERDPTYEIIDGKWLNDEPCGVVHRIAVKHGGKGTGTFCLNWAYEQCGNLKIDTHTDNVPMQRLLKKLHFTHCGTIWVLDGTEERIAFQKAR